MKYDSSKEKEFLGYSSSGIRWVCSLCGKEFIQNRISYEVNGNNLKHICSECKAMLNVPFKAFFVRKLSSATYLYKCPVCGEEYKQNATVVRSMKELLPCRKCRSLSNCKIPTLLEYKEALQKGEQEVLLLLGVTRGYYYYYRTEINRLVGISNEEQQSLVENSRRNPFRRWALTKAREVFLTDTDKILAKTARTNTERYGSACSLHGLTERGRAVQEQAHLTRVEHIKERRAKCVETMKLRYGVASPMEVPEFVEKVRSSLMANRDVARIISSFYKKNTELVFSLYSEGSGTYKDRPYREWQPLVRCLSCGYEFRYCYSSGHAQACPKCSQGYRSVRERSVEKWLESKGIKADHRKGYLSGGEIDVFLPEMKLGFEFNGLYWHSSIFHDAKYHQRKSQLALDKGVKLYHFWEDSSDVFVYDFISKLLGLGVTKIYARKTTVQVIGLQEASRFYDLYHRQGSSSLCQFNFGLWFEGHLVSVLSFRKKSEGVFSNERYCVHPKYQVVGGFLKLLKAGVAQLGCERITTYCDRDLSPDPKETVYYRNGFQLVGDSGPEMRYWVARNHADLGVSGVYARQSFQKKRLVRYSWYDSRLTEQENLARQKVYPVYNSGCWKFEWSKKGLL